MKRLVLLLACLASIATAQVPKGTPIRVMLLKDISSASSRVGETVPFVVTEDVTVGGRVAIPEGAMVFGHISQCRREGALSAAVWDRPARLCVEFEHLRDLEGHQVDLWPKAKMAGELQVTRELTVIPESKQEEQSLRLAWEDQKARPAIDKLRHLFHDQAASLTQHEAETLIEHNVQLPFVQQAIKAGLFDTVTGFISDLKHGRALEALLKLTPATRPAAVAFRAVRELCRVSAGAGRYIDGRFKGRNIHCPAGVELTVYAGA
jgi:hypothetical protein